MKKYNIFYCSTVYHVLLSSLLAYKFKEDTNILVADITSFKCGKDLSKYENIFFDKIFTLYSSDLQLNKSDFLNYKQNVTQKMEIIIPELKYYRRNQNNVFCYICEDGHHFSRYFVFNFSNVVMLEEGEKVYNDISKCETLFKRIIKYHILGINYPNGLDKRVKELWVQYPEKLPNNVKNKGRKIDLTALMKDVEDSTYKSKLLEMLGINEILWNKLQDTFRQKKNRKVILLITQPFSEDRLTTEDNKIFIYESIVRDYCDNAELIIKPHPREITDYQTIFNNALILDNGFPLELLNYIVERNQFDEAITVNSTALMNIENLCRHTRMVGLCEYTSSLNSRCSLKTGYYK